MEWWMWFLLAYLAAGFIFAAALTVGAVRDGYDGGEPGDNLVMFPFVIVLWFPLFLSFVLGPEGLDIMGRLRREWEKREDY